MIGYSKLCFSQAISMISRSINNMRIGYLQISHTAHNWNSFHQQDIMCYGWVFKNMLFLELEA